MEGTLETERLRLSPLTEADLDDLVELDGDAEVRRMVDPLGIIIPVERGERRTYEWERFVSPGGFYATRERVGNAFVGWFQLEEAVDRDGEVELGYRLRRNVWGLGYATEGATALVATPSTCWGTGASSATRSTTTPPRSVSSRRRG